MSRRMTGPVLAASAVSAGFATAVSLVLPWVRIGNRSRSSIDLIGSAGTLEVIEGSVRLAVVAVWFLVPVIVAAAMVAGAGHRLRLSALLLVPLGPILAGVVILAWIVAEDALIWGAYLSAVLAIATSVLAIGVLQRVR